MREGGARDTTECPVKRTLKGQEDDPSIRDAGQGMAGPWERLGATVDKNQGSKVRFRGSKVREGCSQRCAGSWSRDRDKGRSIKGMSPIWHYLARKVFHRKVTHLL